MPAYKLTLEFIPAPNMSYVRRWDAVCHWVLDRTSTIGVGKPHVLDFHLLTIHSWSIFSWVRFYTCGPEEAIVLSGTPSSPAIPIYSPTPASLCWVLALLLFQSLPPLTLSSRKRQCDSGTCSVHLHKRQWEAVIWAGTRALEPTPNPLPRVVTGWTRLGTPQRFCTSNDRLRTPFCASPPFQRIR
jgi:hypothetical protein